MAGLRAAANDVCIVLPVDIPLVTGLLRALADAEAVPQTGPLPGAYSKALLPELETRVAVESSRSAGSTRTSSSSTRTCSTSTPGWTS